MCVSDRFNLWWFCIHFQNTKKPPGFSSNLLLQRLKHGPNWIDRRTKVKRYWWVLRRLIKNRPLGCIRGLFTSNPGAFSKQACQLGTGFYHSSALLAAGRLWIGGKARRPAFRGSQCHITAVSNRTRGDSCITRIPTHAYLGCLFYCNLICTIQRFAALVNVQNRKQDIQ